MTDEEIIEQILDSFEKIYTFLRPHSIEKRPAVRTVANIKKGNRVIQDMFANSALVIISLLTGNGKTFCLQNQVKDIFLWKYENHHNKFIDKDNGALTVLYACDFIDKGHEAAHDSRFKTITLTRKGIDRLEELRKARRKDITIIISIISELRKKDPEFFPYAEISKGISSLANLLWEEVKTKAKSDNKETP